ncbi:hypothetical protein F8564_10010 [Serratia sp. RJAL6]|nr:hypothetical protein F8564_10010 [Enterobacter sp. RJAL6]
MELEEIISIAQQSVRHELKKIENSNSVDVAANKDIGCNMCGHTGYARVNGYPSMLGSAFDNFMSVVKCPYCNK